MPFALLPLLLLLLQKHVAATHFQGPAPLFLANWLSFSLPLPAHAAPLPTPARSCHLVHPQFSTTAWRAPTTSLGACAHMCVCLFVSVCLCVGVGVGMGVGVGVGACVLVGVVLVGV